MFRTITCSGTTAVPHLLGSLLMQNHGARVEFALDKPNVIVGPNGAGKSALVQALSLASLSWFSGVGSFDSNFTRDADALWGESRWRDEPPYLPGLEFDTDWAPSVFFRPGHIPGNDHSVTAAMMCGYFDEAKAYGQTVKAKSSGQAGAALLARVEAVLRGDVRPVYEQINWGDDLKIREFDHSRYVGPWELRANALIRRYAAVADDAIPVVLMDEPEQSLDARRELALWKTILEADLAKTQVIVATHSLYPMLHPERFNVIEAMPGYVQEVRALVG